MPWYVYRSYRVGHTNHAKITAPTTSAHLSRVFTPYLPGECSAEAVGTHQVGGSAWATNHEAAPQRGGCHGGRDVCSGRWAREPGLEGFWQLNLGGAEEAQQIA
ncbi:hypothetical protein GCM10008960_31560 [Deinococcus sedimenti]|uniref:Uncharacterized protein n=1 Tax=Deinococcus sedimenti TaxID=1867090 RepID=A0ABQ2S6J5_9DEIO|nr:hypothetical protein GCM10008960_31560 [Deinococcus sedimenti]